MYWVNDEERRYYQAYITTDLLGDLVVVRNYGSLDTARGAIKTSAVNNQEEAKELLGEIAKTRKRHGYDLIDSSMLNYITPVK